jgi:regulator of sirC expression with transglutaminase-like and TPR domain
MTKLTFEDAISSGEIDVPLAALCFAREIAYPRLDIERHLGRLDTLANAAWRIISPEHSVAEQAEALADFLFIQERLRGNAQDYNDPRNSYLNEVLERRLGIPISLSAVYIAVAVRLGLPAQGIGLPGHFIVSLPASGGDIYIDPFHGGNRLSLEDCALLVRQSIGYDVGVQEEWLQPMAPQAILTRMLNNLRNVYYQLEDWDYALAVIDRLRLLQPELPDLLRDLGMVQHRRGALRQAIQFYETYLTRVPSAPDAGTVRLHLESAVKSLSARN